MNMTSKHDALKTNEFLRRRKLRLQQVREQSKDIARKIRQRAKVENLRHLNSIDAKKEKEYFECQDKLVKHLELLYSKGLQNVGTSHKDALNVTDQDCAKKIDVSKLRGKEAADVLRKQKQEKLDEQKKHLDRKLQAREAANELSREKSATVSKVLTKITSKKCDDMKSSKPIYENIDDQNHNKKNENPDLKTNDMGTQWEAEELLPNQWEPNIPVLSLCNDNSVKESHIPNTENTEKCKRLNLFALSDEMPSSLRGGLTGVVDNDPVHIKPSLTLVSEYLQNRNLMLRQPQPNSSKRTDDLQKIKQTILHTRAARTDVNKDKSSCSTEPNIGLARKKSITVYNHNTRNTQDRLCEDESLVSRDNKTDEDAYAQAFKEITATNSIQKEQVSKHLKDMRTKVAVAKNSVEKEYKETLSFLNSLPRNKKNENEKPIKTAYMDEHHQQLQNERHQRTLQEEFKKIEKECYKHNCKHSKRKAAVSDKQRCLTNKRDMRKDFEYSWMPVPESDGNLAVHTIPNNNTRHKSGNTVKFSQADSYHEYRSRHKHTPPTKDISERQNRKRVETVILQDTNDSDVNETSTSSETSSVENLHLEREKTDDSRIKDSDRIIIYKIVESKRDKKSKQNKKGKSARFANIANFVTDEGKQQVIETEEDKMQASSNISKVADNLQKGVSFEQLQEGIYKAVNNDGDNIASMYFTEDKHDKNGDNCRKYDKTVLSCCCSSNNKGSRDGGELARGIVQENSCKCHSKENNNLTHASAATSATSFTTAFNDKTRLPDGGFVKLVEGGQDSNKFYVGASGFLKDDDYEVIIQLRKKDTERVNNIDSTQPTLHTKPINSVDSVLEMKQNISDTKQNISDTTPSKSRINEPPTSPAKIAATTEENETNNSKRGKEQSLEKEQIDKEPEQSNIDSQLKELCEKAVLTSFQDEFAIPANMPKSDPISRPGTSTYTQTSFNSSLPRPTLMHMSSSTSTAYMSPPELILPKFLKQNYVVTKEELYESENTMHQLDSNFDVIEIEHYNGCRCRNCKSYQSKTPPNTARSRSKESLAGNCAQSKRKLRNKCHNCSNTNVCHKNQKKKSSIINTKLSRDLSTENFNVIPKQSKTKTTCSNSKSSVKIKPIIKNYVNKLLALNNEGLKTIEIINQDCSAITTPGSSIIDLPCNRKKDKSSLENKISLEQIKNILKEKILKDILEKKEVVNKFNRHSNKDEPEKSAKIPIMIQNSFKFPKKKSIHKVKSLNISKRILKKKKASDSYIPCQRLRINSASISSSIRDDNKSTFTEKQKVRSSKISKKYAYYKYKNSTSSDIIDTSNSKQCKSSNIKKYINHPVKNTYVKSLQNKNLKSHKSSKISFSSDSDATDAIFRYEHAPQPSIHTSTQTNNIIDTEMHFMKIAEDKLQNMEKIADLTEKCTKRLSNLAKVLEEVRRNKSLVYSQISASDSTPESDPKPNQNEPSTEISGHVSDPNVILQSKESSLDLTSFSMPEKLDNKYSHCKDSVEFMPFLKDIPRPRFKEPSSSTEIHLTDKSTKVNIESENAKSRGRPPPALSRIHLKSGQDVNIVPHELSTVIEVDSPMSMRIKSQISRQDTKLEGEEKTDHKSEDRNNSFARTQDVIKKHKVDPDLLKSNINLSRQLSKVSLTDSSDDSKMRMMDMKKFNDIMLKPFISLKEYAKQCNIGLNEGSNLGERLKDPVNDELSSLHSDGSLPDVIAELLKRNVISEPFKFDTGSNVNSTTVSSESTLSVLALSKARKEKKKYSIILKNKDNIAETSETLSISSNPDLENAFQKLGMGWASSTLKKTKERLALSSSSNTSSSSMTQFKIKSFSQDVPNLGTDSTSSLLEVSNKQNTKMSSPRRYNVEEISRNAVQQTSLTNSMTVKEFLTNELAKKITFSNKSTRNAEEEFVSLYETKMPEEMKHTNVGIEEDQLSVASANHNRARTSTPVRIFKSQTYHSTSTSNTSNGFFSNADDLSSVKVTSASIRNHSTSDKDDLTIPNYSLKVKQTLSDRSKSD